MYIKLTLRNIKRSIRDYSIYLITLCLSIALIFSFVSLGFSKTIVSLSENMSNFSSYLIIISFIVAIAIGVTVNYATKFIVEKRKKEFAIYLLLGMKPHTVSNMFSIENGIIGIVAFIIGSILGIFISQIFIVIITNIFDVTYNFKIDLSWNAVFITFICFIIMYGINILKTSISIYKKKIIQLLYMDRLNEKIILKNPIINILIIGFSTVLIIISILLFKQFIKTQDNNGFIYLITAIGFIIISLLGIYYSFPNILVSMGMNSKYWKYKDTNLFLLKRISSKINFTGKTLGLLAILLLFALSSISIGLSLGVSYKANIKAESPFDISIGFDIPEIKNFDEITQFISKTVPIKSYVDYQLYKDNNMPDITMLSLSDYNKLRNELGLDTKQIKYNQFIIHCDTWTEVKSIKENLKKNKNITLHGYTFSTNENLIFQEPFEQYRMNGTIKHPFAIILPDFVISKLNADKSRLIVTTVKDAPENIKKDLNFFITKKWNPISMNSLKNKNHITKIIQVKSWSTANSLTNLISLSFSGLYLGLIFIILVGTILALQQISNSSKTKYEYYVLQNIGVDNTEIKRLIFNELLIAFLSPTIIPIILIIIIAILGNHYFGKLILIPNVILTYTSISLIIFFIIYMIYFVVTYISYKENIYNFIKH